MGPNIHKTRKLQISLAKQSLEMCKENDIVIELKTKYVKYSFYISSIILLSKYFYINTLFPYFYTYYLP